MLQAMKLSVPHINNIPAPCYVLCTISGQYSTNLYLLILELLSCPPPLQTLDCTHAQIVEVTVYLILE